MTLNDINNNIGLCYKIFQSIITEKRNYSTESILSWHNYTKGIDKSLYHKQYENIFQNKQYSFLLIDNSILQFYYEYDEKSLKKIKLAYYPHPEKIKETSEDICKYFDETDCETMLGIYQDTHELLDQEENISSTTFIRIDYDRDVTSHTTCHLQIAAINELRIPVEKITLPFIFFDFIVKNSTSFKEKWDGISSKHAYKVLARNSTKQYLNSGLSECNMYLKLD